MTGTRGALLLPVETVLKPRLIKIETGLFFWCIRRPVWTRDRNNWCQKWDQKDGRRSEDYLQRGAERNVRTATGEITQALAAQFSAQNQYIAEELERHNSGLNTRLEDVRSEFSAQMAAMEQRQADLEREHERLLQRLDKRLEQTKAELEMAIDGTRWNNTPAKHNDAKHTLKFRV